MIFGTIETGVGFWNAIIWIASLSLLLTIVYIFHNLGEKKYKRETDQTMPFLSGNIEEEEELQVKSSNIYWGFVTALDDYYRPMKSIHTGIVNDYTSLLIGIMALILIIITLTEVII